MQPDLKYWAHWKLDATGPGLHLLAISQGRVARANIVTLAPSGQVLSRRELTLSRNVYIHDWFVTENYFAFLLHPAFINLGRMLSVLIGRETFASAIQWQPEKESVFFIAHRHRDQSWSIPVKACWMWHAINAFEDGDDLVCDFIGSERGGGLEDELLPLFQLMSGVDPGTPGRRDNWIRRYRVRPSVGQIEEQIIADHADFELPCLSATERAKPYSKAYMIQADPRELFARNLCQLDGETLETVTYSFSPGQFCSEPVLCDVLGDRRGRYLITQVYSATEKTSHFAVFDEASFSEGPIARIPLTHHVPVSFHGYWSSA